MGSPWPPRWATGAGSLERPSSWGSAAWSQASCSSGHSVHRGRLTKAGNAHLRAQLVESAWTYRHRPYVGRAIAGRQLGLDPEVVARAWAAQLRLSARFRALAARKNTKSIVAAAIARELAGFLWAEMVA